MIGKLYSKTTRAPTKLTGSLRGDGVLAWSGPPVAVRYQLDLYRAGDDRSGRGTLDGPLAPLMDADAKTAVLRLDGGFELAVTLVETDVDGADFDATGELPTL